MPELEVSSGVLELTMSGDASDRDGLTGIVPFAPPVVHRPVICSRKVISAFTVPTEEPGDTKIELTRSWKATKDEASSLKFSAVSVLMGAMSSAAGCDG